MHLGKDSAYGVFVLVDMATVGILGEALDAVLRGLERRLLRWRRGTGAGELFYQGAEP